MFDLFADIPFVSLFIKFMVASSLLLSTVWLMEKIRLINTPDLAELAWKTAIAGSFLALLPVADFMSSTFVIENDRTAALIDDLNEHRPFSNPGDNSEVITKVNLQENTATPAQIEFGKSLTVDSKNITVPGLDTLNSDAPQRAFTLENTSATDADNAPQNTQSKQPEGDSETSITNPVWQSVAELRAKDLAMLGWISLALLAVAALIFSYRSAVKNLGSRNRVHAEDPSNKALRAICTKADIKHVPYLSRSSNIQSPVCLPRREICLPDWAFETMPDTEFKSLLAHELGHMVRRDPIMLMALQLLSRIFFFQPLFIMARRRLTDIAELAADEWAAKQAADSRAVANALFTCATKINETRQIQWGLAMAGNKSILKQRVERLINAQSVPFKSAGIAAKTALGVGVIGLSLGLPSIEFAGAMTAGSSIGHDIDTPVIASTAIAPVAPLVAVTPNTPNVTLRVAPFATAYANTTANAVASAVHPHNRHFTANKSDSSGNIHWSRDGRKISVNWEGDFRINDTDDFIITEDKDGFLHIKSTDGGIKRVIKFEVEDGKHTHTYWKDGKKQDLDAGGKKWLKSAIHMLIDSGFGAEERVTRILKKDKVKGVLKEIKRFDSDYIRRIYLTLLMDQATLKDREILQVIDITAGFDSDFEKRLTLSVLLTEEKVSDKVLPKVLAIAKSFDSDFEKRLLVTFYVSELKLTDKSTDVIIEIAEDIDSDFELRLLLAATLSDAKLSNKNVEKIFDMAVHNMDSDFEKRLMLSSFADQFGASDKAVGKVLAATDTMDSDFEQRLMLGALISEAKLNEKNWLAAIEIASDIDSDFEKSLALTHMRGEIPKDNKKVVAALDKAMKDINQHYSDAGHSSKNATDLNEARAKRDQARVLRDQKRAMRDQQRAARDIQRDQDRALRDQQRAVRDHQRALDDARREQDHERSELAREKAEMLQNLNQEFAHAMREITHELNRLQRDLGKADVDMKVGLSRAIKQLELRKKELAMELGHEQAAIAQEIREFQNDVAYEAMLAAQLSARITLETKAKVLEKITDSLASDKNGAMQEFAMEMQALDSKIRHLQKRLSFAEDSEKAEISRRVNEIELNKMELTQEYEFEKQRWAKQAEQSKAKTTEKTARTDKSSI